MKNKTHLRLWINLSLLCLLPLFASGMMMMLISGDWIFNMTGDPGRLATAFLTGTFNKVFSLVLFVVGTFGLAIVWTTLIMVSRYTPFIDRFEEATEEMLNEKEKYHQATQSFHKHFPGLSPKENNNG